MDAEELLIHNSSQGQTAECVDAGVVDSLRVLVLALKLEGKIVRQMTAFMVSPEQPERLRVMNLERPQVEDALDTEVASVDVVSQEEIASLSGVATNFEKLHQIVVLSVDISADGDGGIHLKKVRLGPKYFGALPDNP